MTSIRERVRRWLGRGRTEQPAASSFSYRVFWTREARQWPPERRADVRVALGRVVHSEGFVETEFERRYRVDGLDGQAHSGASLVALETVLDALTSFSSSPQEAGNDRS
jgi:hypothetical protein